MSTNILITIKTNEITKTEPITTEKYQDYSASTISFPIPFIKIYSTKTVPDKRDAETNLKLLLQQDLTGFNNKDV